MTDAPTVVDIVDSPTLKRIRSSCGCVFIYAETDADRGVSLYFCADHATNEDGPVVYDSTDPVTLHDPFGWDYNVWPGLPIT